LRQLFSGCLKLKKVSENNALDNGTFWKTFLAPPPLKGEDAGV
jgi:hypothetical protein